MHLSLAVIVGIALDLPERERFFTLLFLFLSYLAVEVLEVGRSIGNKLLLNPAVLATVVTFGIFMGISSVFPLIFGDDLLKATLGDAPHPWMTRALLYTFLAAAAMWAGYRARVGQAIAARIRRWAALQRLLRREYILDWRFVSMALFVGIAARWLQISLGLFGYSSEAEQLATLSGFTQLLTFGAGLGKLVLAVASLALFRFEGKRRGLASLVLLLLAVETAFGFLSGFKSQVVIPFLIVGFCHYAVRGRLPRSFLAVVVVLIAASYFVIEPFRLLRYSSDRFEGRDIARIGAQMLGTFDTRGTGAEQRKTIAERLAFNVLHRANHLPDAARSIQFKEESELPEGSPSFLGNLLMFPLHAFVPRLLWPEKPLQNLGRWHAINVYGLPPSMITATAMTPVAYLYFAGGGFAVAFVFFCLGTVQRALFDAFRDAGSGGLLILLVYLGHMALMESSVDALLISLVRTFPLLLLAQYLLFRE
jgi:hypothetical protein